VYPYHAAGMSLDLNNASRTSAAPTTFTWFPVDRASTWDVTDETAADAGQGASDTDPVFDDQNYGPGASDDMFFAYHYHPGRGGIVGTSDVIGGVSAQVGSFNILYPIMTYNDGRKYYQKGDSESGPQFQRVYMNASKAYDSNYHGENFGTGADTAICNNSYTDQYGKDWNFCNVTNVPYTNYKINPTDADNADIYWATVPYFDPLTVSFPTINDEVRLLNVDCSIPVVEAWSKQSTDFWANGSTIIPEGGDGLWAAPDPTKFYLQVNGGGNENMSWDGTKWSVTPSSCVTDDILTVTSEIGGGTGSASFRVP